MHQHVKQVMEKWLESGRLQVVGGGGSAMFYISYIMHKTSRTWVVSCLKYAVRISVSMYILQPMVYAKCFLQSRELRLICRRVVKLAMSVSLGTSTCRRMQQTSVWSSICRTRFKCTYTILSNNTTQCMSCTYTTCYYLI